MSGQSNLFIRSFDPARDQSAVLRLDTTVNTEFVYRLEVAEDSLTLRPARLPTPVLKSFDIDLEESRPQEASVITEAGEVRGFIGWNYERWHHRLAIWHFYVDRVHRHRGLGRMLMWHAIESGHRLGALNAWIETSNRNYPGIMAYRHLGFQLCGADQTLYSGTHSSNEFAIFMARPLHVPDVVLSRSVALSEVRLPMPGDEPA